MMEKEKSAAAAVSRRELLRSGSALASAGLALGGPAVTAAAPALGLRLGPDIYQSIGVRPLINCRGVITIIGGSLMLPEVKRAMDEASLHYVHLDHFDAHHAHGVVVNAARVPRADHLVSREGRDARCLAAAK